MNNPKRKDGEPGCVILAGGKSIRMGMDKALVEYNGETFIGRLMRELDWFEEKLIARGEQAEIWGAAAGGWRVISDVFQNQGPLGGLHAALCACEAEAVFVVSCDMPLVKSSLVRDLIARWEESGRDSSLVGVDAVIAAAPDGSVHPLCGIYSKAILPVLEEQLNGNQNRVMELLRKLRVRLVVVDAASEAGQLANINTRQELEQL